MPVPVPVPVPVPDPGTGERKHHGHGEGVGVRGVEPPRLLDFRPPLGQFSPPSRHDGGRKPACEAPRLPGKLHTLPTRKPIIRCVHCSVPTALSLKERPRAGRGRW